MTVADGWGAPSSEPASLRELAARGELGTTSGAARRALYRAAWSVAHPIVFDAVTRRLEQRRGHARCARGLRLLDGPCLDGFHDDVEAVVDHLFATSRPIHDLEAWLTARAPNATIDGHRRRRGDRGALQRPRMTRTLAAALPDDPWLHELALRLLVWVGLPVGAGAVLWPIEVWARDRAAFTGDREGSTPARVQAEVDVVLAAMRRRPDWYAAHVERPLGGKTAPVAGSPGDSPGDPRPLTADPGEIAETRIVETAAAAVQALAAGLASGRDVAGTVERVLRTLFLDGTGVEEIDRPPGAGAWAEARLSALLGDPVARDALIGRVVRLIGEIVG
ncbi:hypothetical protein GCM10010168_46590 [Actinoplanes ianthinogenes]|uniref:Uncharacterized protein n=1 Tax=Actinoplanes ianthinogenes TaxID=122358 RepID=A0ABM7LP77_9ACTN|nr:hypothetical protein [Actinoplanes ianthinogenes]BCJ41042.1 hypothetical protein Aiant_16990 [Actinoplanes ianthinogenes]GGR23299.1 hypothetical protein GCM10010168_46590 [Actinoplanes ianthinogenes]